MITQLQWICGSLALIYIFCAAWTFGYARGDGVHPDDACFCAAGFPIYWFAIVFFLPIAKMGNNFAAKRAEKQARIEAHEQEVRTHLESVEKELDEEMKQPCL
jgi:hypothetical protein